MNTLNIREHFNSQFSPEKYQEFLEDIYQSHQHQPPFRIAESPVFIPPQLQERLLEACGELNAVICQPDFKDKTDGAFPKGSQNKVPGNEGHTLFLQYDFGICLDENGLLIPQLIEAQGFPSLYFFQDLLAKAYQNHYDIPSDYSAHYDGLNAESYMEILREEIVGAYDPRQVVLLEIEPEKQTTYIDFLVASEKLGIKVLCVSKLKKRGRDLFYLDEQGEEVPVQKIFNRVIFEELWQRPDLKLEFSFQDEVNVEWVGHPNWFFRISKHTLPLLKSKYVPESYYLHELDTYPADLENFVLKPLFSFAGMGVKIDLCEEDLRAIEDPENYILQRKVAYHPIIETTNPHEPAKCEIRMLMIWRKGEPFPRIVNNLARLSKGKMIGVRYNKDKDWVGASVGFFNTRTFASNLIPSDHQRHIGQSVAGLMTSENLSERPNLGELI